MESVNAVKLYDGDGGNAQTEFILDSEVGWEQVVNNPNLHVTKGVSEHSYPSSQDRQRSFLRCT